MRPLFTNRAPWCRSVISLALLLALPALAQTTLIKLGSDDEQRLGIRYERVTANTASDGFPVPAEVIHPPQQRVQLTAFFSGNLAAWHIQSGQAVAQGQVVASINSPELMTLQEQWLAALNHNLDMAQQLRKDKALHADGIISRQRLQQSERAHRQAVFSLQAHRQQLYQAGISDQDLDTLQTGQQAPGVYLVRAPLGGVVSRQSLAVGDTLSAGQSLGTVTDSSALWLRAKLPLPLAQQVEAGDALAIANSAATLTLVSKNSTLSPSTQQVEILARFDQVNWFYPGQQVALIIPSQRVGYRIPAAAVTHNGDATVVYVQVVDGVEARQLALTPLGEDYLAVDNIRADEQLVVQGSAQLKGIQLGLGGGE